MNVKAGASAIGQLGGSTLTVPSMSFDQDVTLILKAADPPIPGPVGTVFRVEQTPATARARNPLRFQIALALDQQAQAADLRLATYKDKSPTGLWLALPGQVYDATPQTLAGQFFTPGQRAIFFRLLEA